MTQYNSLNVKLSNSQLNKLKSSIKNETDVVLRISSTMVGNSNDNTNFPHELLLTNRQVAYKMSQYIPPYNNSSENIKVELDLSNYATKKDIKVITHVDTSSYALKTNLAALKTEVDNIDTDKLKTVPNDLAKLSNVIKMMLLKRLNIIL